MLAEVLAFLHLNCEIKKENNKNVIIFKTRLPLVAIRFLKNLKVLYQIKTDLDYVEKTNITKKQIVLKIKDRVDEIISEHALFDKLSDEKELLTKTDEQKRAYLRAAFISSGSVNNPNKAEYHLEIYAKNKRDIIFLQRIFNHFNLNAKIIKRRKGFIVYLKEAEKIANFIILVGANNTLFEYEDLRIKRDFNNSINRLINCEIANQEKINKSSLKLLNAISYLEKINTDLIKDPLITEAITIRKENPEASLNELTEIYYNKYGKTISKSGLNHRFKKILKIKDYLYEN